MTTRQAFTIAIVLFAGTTASILLTPAKTRSSLPDQTSDLQEAEDPFADMIEEGDGLLAQHKAEAAAKGRIRART